MAATDVDVTAGRPLTGGAVDVWRVVLDDVSVENAEDLLSPEELERARRLRLSDDRQAFLASRVALRSILGGQLGRDPADIRFVVSSRGKPSVVDGEGLSFSLSRSAPLALVAVGRERLVGVDIERIRPLADLDVLADRYLPPAATRALRGKPEPERLDAFFAHWVRLEAAVKLTGVGLTGAEGPKCTEAVGAGVGVSQLRVAQGFAAAVAVAGPAGPVTRNAFSG